jgi:hypothetical protein
MLGTDEHGREVLSYIPGEAVLTSIVAGFDVTGHVWSGTGGALPHRRNRAQRP